LPPSRQRAGEPSPTPGELRSNDCVARAGTAVPSSITTCPADGEMPKLAVLRGAGQRPPARASVQPPRGAGCRRAGQSIFPDDFRRSALSLTSK
jgi:hypothetical protein